MCDAEARIKQALFVLENEWGCGRIDVGGIRHILQGGIGGLYTNECEEPTHARAG